MHACLTSRAMTSAAKFVRKRKDEGEDIGRSSAMTAITEGGRGRPRSGPRSEDWEEEGCAESYTCARARARASVCDSIGAVVAVRLLAGACWCAAATAGGVDRGAAGAVWLGVCQSVGESCRRCSVDVAGI